MWVLESQKERLFKLKTVDTEGEPSAVEETPSNITCECLLVLGGEVVPVGTKSGEAGISFVDPVETEVVGKGKPEPEM